MLQKINLPHVRDDTGSYNNSNIFCHELETALHQLRSGPPRAGSDPEEKKISCSPARGDVLFLYEICTDLKKNAVPLLSVEDRLGLGTKGLICTADK